MKLQFKKLRSDAFTPTRGSEMASGLDLYSPDKHVLYSGETIKVEIGIAFNIPTGCEVQVRPRSGLSLKTGLRIVNSPATIDQDYQGDCSVLIQNTSDEYYTINRGDRIAQAVLCPVFLPMLEEVTSFGDTTERGEKGFGSSGV
jgi:dUTP pyrophosphatase